MRPLARKTASSHKCCFGGAGARDAPPPPKMHPTAFLMIFQLCLGIPWGCLPESGAHYPGHRPHKIHATTFLMIFQFCPGMAWGNVPGSGTHFEPVWVNSGDPAQRARRGGGGGGRAAPAGPPPSTHPWRSHKPFGAPPLTLI